MEDDGQVSALVCDNGSGMVKVRGQTVAGARAGQRMAGGGAISDTCLGGVDRTRHMGLTEVCNLPHTLLSTGWLCR